MGRSSKPAAKSSTDRRENGWPPDRCRVRNRRPGPRRPESRYVRIPLAILFIAQSFLFFLPIAGIEFLPIGLLLIAQDVPFLKRPVGRAILWLENKWVAFRKRRDARGSDRTP